MAVICLVAAELLSPTKQREAGAGGNREKQYMTGNRKKKNFRTGIRIFMGCLGIAVILVVLGILGIASLLIADGNYDFFRNTIVFLLGRANHFDGSLWFSAGVTFIGAVISAVPGLLCGVFALIQTHRLHVLESRYHRPAMELDKVELRVMKTDDITEIRSNLKLDARQNHSIGIVSAQGDKYYIDLQVSIFLKNEILIKTLYPKNVVFSFYNGTQCVLEPMEKMNEDNRHKVWDLERKLTDGQMKYTCSFNLCPRERGMQANEMWKDFKEFVFYEERRNPKYQYMTMNMYLDIAYEYDGGQEAENLLKIEFDAAQTVTGKWQTLNESSNGYFTFDLEG